MNNNNLSTLILSGSLVFAAANPALAANVTIVTDAIGTQEKWTFVDQYGSKRMTRRENLSDGRLYKQTWYSHGDLANKHDEKNRQTSYTYDYYTQQLTNESQPYRGAGRYGGVWSWGLWKNTSYEYVSPDTDLVTKTTTNGIFDFQNKETVNTYDDNLNLTSVTINGFNADGQSVSRQTNFEFDQFGKVTQIDGPRTDVADITTLVYYNCTTGAECGELQQVVNALGHITTYDHYDGAGRLLQSTDPNGTSTAYSYHPRGWLLSMVQTPVSGTARITDYQYDNTGQLTQVTLPDGAALNYVYDAAHDLRETSDNLGNKVTYTYDAKGNLTHELVHDPDGILVNSTVTTYDIHNFVQSINRGGSLMQFSTDETGNVSAAVDPNSNPNTTHEYDLLDRLASTVDALTNTSAYSYNVADQLTQVTAPNGAVTQYEYDDLGNQTKEISADRGTITYAHDDAGNVTSMTDARGITTNYQYDALNRLTAVNYPTSTEDITYTYDTGCSNGTGRLCQVQDDSGTETYDYDAWGNVTQSQKQETGRSGAVLGTYTTGYQYDAANRVTQVTYPSGRTVTINRDAIGRLIGMNTEHNGATSNLINTRSYRADGVWTEQTYGNGLVQSKTYDLQSRLTNHVAGSYQRDYNYDANGNILSADAPDNSVDRDYAYDVLDRLTQDNDPIRAQVRNFG